MTSAGTETLNLGGYGNPLNFGTGLVRSAFRPSDDATIFGFLIPANAMMVVELRRTARMLETVGKTSIAEDLIKRAKVIEDGIWEYGVVDTKKWGKVFAYEVDGYGSHLLMDDANVPSLLALPRLGFISANHEVYQNTRKMILNRSGNPYYIEGATFKGIGGPHAGVENPWPLSRLMQALTSDDDDEITDCLTSVLNVSPLGLVHESVRVSSTTDYTRPWFAWANSVFAQTIIDLAARKPHLIFGSDAKPYVVGS